MTAKPEDVKAAMERLEADAKYLADHINAIQVRYIAEHPDCRVRYLGDTAKDIRTILAALSTTQAERDAAIARAEAAEAGSQFRPGVFRCAKCALRVVSTTLHAQSGETSLPNTGGQCPNSCGPLWPVTWESECRAADVLVDAVFDRAEAAERDLSAVREGLERACTCHPDDKPPVPCPKCYVLSECRVEARSREEALRAMIAYEIRDGITTDIHFDLCGVERTAELIASKVTLLPTPSQPSTDDASHGKDA